MGELLEVATPYLTTQFPFSKIQERTLTNEVSRFADIRVLKQ